MAIRHEQVMDSWVRIIEGGAGHAKNFLDTVEQQIKETKMPHVTTGQQDISGGIFGAKRLFLCVNHDHLRDYRVYVGARDYGIHLDVSVFLTIQPRLVKRLVSKYAAGSPDALSQNIDFFSQQDLSAFSSIVKHYVVTACERLFEELKLDPSSLNPSSKGFLSAW